MSSGGRVAAVIPGAGAGFSLLELLVVASLTSLVAGAVLVLMAGGAAAGRARGAELESLALARAAVDAVASDLARAGQGLEGAVGLMAADGPEPWLRPAGPDAVTILLAGGAPVEVEPLPGPGRYRLGRAVRWRRGDRVAALGLASGAGAAAPVGVVRRLLRSRRGVRSRYGVVEIDWTSAGAAGVGAGVPRALVHVLRRHYATRIRDGAVQLRRRDDQGRWQPVVDGLVALRIAYLLDTDGDGRADTDPGVLGDGSAIQSPGLRVLAARVWAAAQVGIGRARAASRWVRLRPGSGT